MRRTRHIIATHFYPDRAQPRALHLYNKVLEERMRRWGMLADIQKAKFNVIIFLKLFGRRFLTFKKTFLSLLLILFLGRCWR